MNDAGLRIRVDSNLRHEFISICKAQDQTAAQVLRTFMRDYVDKNRHVWQRELFAAPSSAPQPDDDN